MSLSTLFARLRRWHKVQETIHQLEALDDRELYDLGISRWQIPEIARRTQA